MQIFSRSMTFYTTQKHILLLPGHTTKEGVEVGFGSEVPTEPVKLLVPEVSIALLYSILLVYSSVV